MNEPVEPIAPYLPRAFRVAWVLVVDEPLPEVFVEAYYALCQALYFGVQPREPWERVSGGRPDRDLFADHRLLGTKVRADRALAEIAQALFKAIGGQGRASSAGVAKTRREDRPRPH